MRGLWQVQPPRSCGNVWRKLVKRHKIDRTMNHDGCGQDLQAAIGPAFLGDGLFDRVADTVFFVKDEAARYVAVNTTLVRRCGLSGKAALIGRTTAEVFPSPLGESFGDQDRHVLREKLSIDGQLERHLYPDGHHGWCLTWKVPICAADGRVVGLSGISRDVQPVARPHSDLAALSAVLDHIRDHLDAPLRLADLAARAHMSVYQFDRRIRSLFGLSAGQYLNRARIDLACNRLQRTDEPISLVALRCGYSDQAAFTRQFRRSVGLTPRAYRMTAATVRPRGFQRP
jgi:PAS domain S-box-containing protein